MMIEKVCQICGKAFSVPHWRKETAKYCSTDCQRESLHGAKNVVCTNCGKPFHMKLYRMQRSLRNMGYFCSRSCVVAYRKIWFRGANNHQYGLKGHLNASFKGAEVLNKNNKNVDVVAYAPDRYDADKRGRVTKHRLLVEENWQLYRQDAFDVINGQHVLKKGFDVHHVDGNHNNNELSNLAVLTRGEHVKAHNATKRIIRNPINGRIIGIARIDRAAGGYGSTGI